MSNEKNPVVHEAIGKFRCTRPKQETHAKQTSVTFLWNRCRQHNFNLTEEQKASASLRGGNFICI